MKNSLFLLFTFTFSLIWAQVTISPATFEVSDEITITIDANSTDTDCNGFTSPTEIYMHSGIGTDANPWQNVVGNWGQNDGIGEMTNNGNGTWSITITPQTYYGLNPTQAAAATKMGMVFRNGAGTQEFKDNGCTDFFINVGNFQLTLNTPEENSVTVVPAGTSVNIIGSTTQLANYTLTANGSVVNTQNSTASYTYSYTVNGTNEMVLTASNTSGDSQSKSFTLVEQPDVQVQAIPSWIEQGINYNSDPTKAGVAIYAPGKDYIHVIGDFNNWTLSDTYLMKRDSNNQDLFWLEITGLTPGEFYAFQYRTSDNRVVADPYSPLILSSYDDQWISDATYPNLPDYPTGQDFEASIIQTNQSEYPWVVTDFEKPAQEDLVVYELLLRDFTEEKNWQSLIDRIDYLKGLNINAIELMPIMEFDGNNSWGYNPSFHYALDKTYGTPEKFKEFVDLCHQNGIAVILDIALNHATGRSPLARLWNIDPDGNGFGPIRADNPYFNQTATHAYSVFEDLNHSNNVTRYYVERVVQHWIEEYKIDGYRWDLTKGFTQNCTGNEGCTNQYQQDRVDVLKLYADYQWAVDPTSYVIFEHLGTANEEAQWANHRLNEGKGIMLWNKISESYGQNTMGYSNNSNFGWMDFEGHGFGAPRAVGYGESHDEERLMYKNLNFGNSLGGYNVRNLDTALERQKAYGAIFLTIPGPKMIWQFGELGYDFSIDYCEDGTIDGSCRTVPKPVAFTLGYDSQANRTAVYDTWSDILAITQNNDVFSSSAFNIESGNLRPRIYIWDDTMPSSELKNVVVLANMDLTVQSIVGNLPYTGTWYNLMTNTPIAVNNTNMAFTLQPGEFIILGNQPAATMSTQETAFDSDFGLNVVENPVKGNEIKIEYTIDNDAELLMYDMNGKLISSNKLNAGNGTYAMYQNLNNGVYILVMKNAKNQVSEKIIIQ